MAAPSYSTDLTDIGTGDEASGWIEFTGTISGEAYNTQGAPAYEDPDYPFIQGLYSVTQDCTKDASVGSLGAPTGTSITIPTDGAVLVWHNYMVASNIGTYAQGGLQVCIGTDASNFHTYYTGGVDKSPYPYGGWVNHAATTAVTPDGTAGTVTTIDYVGSAVFVTTGSSKGEVHNVDAIRYGRCSAIFELGDVTNGYCTFDGFATVNDYNDVTNGYNRWGLLQKTAGGYLWKGHMSIGTSTNAAEFVDSNKTIFIDWTPAVTANFNTIEILNANTIIDWTSVSFICLDTTTASPGRLVTTDNASVTMNGCSFTDMNTLSFLSNAEIIDTTFRRCNIVSNGDATFTGCTFSGTTAPTTSGAVEFTSNTGIAASTDLVFNSYTGRYAVYIPASVTGTITFDGWLFDGTGTDVYWAGTTGTLTVNLSNGSNASTFASAGGTVSFQNTVTLTLTNIKDGSKVFIYDTNETVDEDDDTILATTESGMGVTPISLVDTGVNKNSFSFSYNAGTLNGTTVNIKVYNLNYIMYRQEYVLTSLSGSIPISQTTERNFINP